jgi:anthranilate synthase component II
LVHLLHELNQDAEVWRNDKFELEAVNAFDKILLSPGPGIPSEAGLLLKVIEKYASTKSILGVCLGQQAIAEVFGGELYNLEKPVHGTATNILVKDKAEIIFKDLPDTFKVGRYHSWAVKSENLPKELIVTAEDEKGVMMALRHRDLDVRGVQFHPESVLTEFGKEMIKNWLES